MTNRRLYIDKEGQVCKVDDQFQLSIFKHPQEVAFFWQDLVAAAPTGYPEIRFSARFFGYQVKKLRGGVVGEFCDCPRSVPGPYVIMTRERLEIVDSDPGYLLIALTGYRQYNRNMGVPAVCESKAYFLISLDTWGIVCDLCGN